MIEMLGYVYSRCTEQDTRETACLSRPISSTLFVYTSFTRLLIVPRLVSISENRISWYMSLITRGSKI